MEVVWCEDDPLNVFLQNLRDGRDAIQLAASASSNPLAPRWQDGHGWGYVHPDDSSTVGPVICRHFKQIAKYDLTETRSAMRYESEKFLMDCGINLGSMKQFVPEQYRQSAARISNIDPEMAERHDQMHFAYKKLQEIDNNSINGMQDQGSAEIIITILAAHMKRELDNIGRTSDEAEAQLDRIANEAQVIESNAIKD